MKHVYTIELNGEQLDVIAETIEFALEQLDMDNMVAITLLKQVQAKLPEISDRVLK